MIVFAGQMGKMGHLVQPMARATGQRVMLKFSKSVRMLEEVGYVRICSVISRVKDALDLRETSFDD